MNENTKTGTGWISAIVILAGSALISTHYAAFGIGQENERNNPANQQAKRFGDLADGKLPDLIKLSDKEYNELLARVEAARNNISKVDAVRTLVKQSADAVQSGKLPSDNVTLTK